MSTPDSNRMVRRAQARVFWAAVWLALALVALKASYLGSPADPAVPVGGSYLRSLAAISYLDVVFAMFVWTAGSLLLSIGTAVRAVSLTAVALSALFCFYALVNVILFGILGGFITYPLLLLIGNVRMLSSSVNAHLTTSNILGNGGCSDHLCRDWFTRRLKLSARGRSSRWQRSFRTRWPPRRRWRGSSLARHRTRTNGSAGRSAGSPRIPTGFWSRPGSRRPAATASCE